MNVKTKIVVVAGLLLVALVAALFWPRGPIDGGVPGQAGSARVTTASPRPSSEIVLSIAPGVARSAKAAVVDNVSPLMKELAKSHDYKAIYDRLKGSAQPTGEELYLMASLLERCATITDKKEQYKGKWRLGGDDARTRFVNSLSPKAPDREKRIAAFDAVNFDECEGLRATQTSRKEIRSLFERSAAAGDPKGRVGLLQAEIDDARRGSDGEPDYSKPISLSNAQVETWKQIVASGDPRALVDGVQLMMMNYDNVHLRGPDEAPIDYMSLYLAAALAACDLGRRCGPDSPYLQQGCAFEGHCDAADLRDYLLFYAAAPGSSQQVMEYQAQLLRAIRQNDWSFFTFAPGPTPSFAPFQRTP